MAATSALAAAILKTHYVGKLRRMLNDESVMIDLFKESTHDTDGSRIEFPVHTSRNTGVQNMSETGYVAVPTQQGTESCYVYPHYTQGSMALYHAAMLKAKKKGMRAFIRLLDLETNGIKNDVKQICDRRAVSGHRCKGVISGLGAGLGAGTTQAAAQIAPAANVVQDWWDYDGEFSCFDGTDPAYAAVVNANPVTWRRCFLTAVDRTNWGSQTAVLALAMNNVNIFVTDYNKAAGQIRLGIGSDDAGPGGQGITLAGLDVGMQAAALHMHDVQAVDSTGLAPMGSTLPFQDEQTGLFDMMFNPNFTYDLANGWAGLDRTAATGSTVLQSLYFETNVTGGPAARQALGLQRIQYALDYQMNLYGEDHSPTVIKCNALQRSRYMDLVRLIGGGYAADGLPKPKGLDPAIKTSRMAYDGMPVRTSNKVPNGCFLFLDTNSLFLTELDEGDWLEKDGLMLKMMQDAVGRRVGWEAFWWWGYNHYTDDPQGHFMLGHSSL